MLFLQKIHRVSEKVGHFYLLRYLQQNGPIFRIFTDNFRKEPTFGSDGTLSPWNGGVPDTLKQAPTQMCYHVKYGSSATKGVRINRKEPPKLGSAGASLPCGRGVVDP